MQRWLQFLLLLLAASACAHVPEPKANSRLDDLNGDLVQGKPALQVEADFCLGANDSSRSADFPVCCIAGFPTRRAHDVVPAADLEIGDTAGWETCATLEADAGGSPREINAGTGQRPTSGNRELLQQPDTAKLSHGEIITYLLAANQTLAASYRYDPYGNTTYSSGSLAAANVYRFSSKELHLNSGLYSYGYRFYSPNWQRWLNQDPIGEWGGINLYGFVGNDPIQFIDPYGLDLDSPGMREGLIELSRLFWDLLNRLGAAEDRANQQYAEQIAKLFGKGDDPATVEAIKHGIEDAKLVAMPAGKNPCPTRAPIHHLATDKYYVSPLRGGPWSPRFEALFKKAGKTLNDADRGWWEIH